nr:LOW QUALITY PROTEIN: DNA polymerase zeta catalytic subunit [Cavia porcellus]
MFSVRIVTADYYMASPLQGLDICQSPLTQIPVKKVPVVRVFGATPAGERARGARRGREREPAGAFPRRAHARTPRVFAPLSPGRRRRSLRLLCVRRRPGLGAAFGGAGTAVAAKGGPGGRDMYVSVDRSSVGPRTPSVLFLEVCGKQRGSVSSVISGSRALNVALGNPSSTAQHVFKVSLVSGMPFYGYHEKERHFMKIYLYNPAMVKRICELLQSGAIMNKFYQPHEAHIPYLLQLFIDYNLYGMNLINLAAVKFRKSRRKSDTLTAAGSPKDQLSGNSLAGTFFRWEEDKIPSSLILEGVEPQSTCELEVDAVAADILNRLDIESQIGGNPGLQAIWEDEKQRRRNKNESSQISQPESQDRRFLPATESEKKFQKRLQEILKQNDFSVKLSGSVDYSDGSQEFSAELTLHSDILSPEMLQCTPANMIEVHRDIESTKADITHKVGEALINEEAILNLMENSQTFQPLTQRLSESPIFMDSSPDEALVRLLAGLESDGYQGERNSKPAPCQSFGDTKNPQNSDDEENEPQIEKEEMELSMVMSQRWDSNIEEHCAPKSRHTIENTLGKNSFSFSNLSHSKTKLPSDGHEKGNSTALNSLFPSSLTENRELLSCSGENKTVVHSLDCITDESGLNKLKIRYEEFQEHKTEKPSLSQQAAHYMFFPSVVLSNCLSRPQKLSPVTYKLQPANKPSRLKLNKKKLVGHQEASTKSSEIGSTKDSCLQNNPYNSNPEKNNVLAGDLSKAPCGAFENKTPTDSFLDCHFGDGTLETEQSFGLYGNKYTLRAKRKVNYETEDSESSFVTHNSKISLPHPMEIGESLDGTLKSRKRRKMSKKLPPVIIKYIIINRFRGRKNMLVKLGKIDSKEKQVILTEEKMELYKKLAPLKDFWPKVPDSPATKYPIYPLTPKKSHRRNSKHKSAKKKTGKQQRTSSENIKRTLSFRKKRAHAILSLPSPSYNAETEDCDLNYSDVMSKLGFLSERSTSPINSSPPRCWSPTDPKAEEIMAAAEKASVLFKGPNSYNSKTVNSRVGKSNRSRVQVKKSKAKHVNPSVVTKKRNKRNQTNKLIDDGTKKPRAKQKQKTSEKNKSKKHVTALKDEKIKSQSGAEVKFVLKNQNVSEPTKSSGSSQVLLKQKEVSQTGAPADHPLSVPQPSGISAQQKLSGCFSSYLESKKSADLQTFPSSRDDLHSSVACGSIGSGISKINIQRSHNQSAMFTLKESTLIQKNIFDLSNHLSQVAQSTQISSSIMSPKIEESANLQKNYLSSIGKLNEFHNSLESKPDQVCTPNFLHCKDSQQQLVCKAEQSKHSETCSSGNAASEESQMPNNCFATSLRSPIRQIAWEQKQRGFILDMSNFKPEKAKQRSLSQAISQTKALSQCKNQTVSTPSAFVEGQSGLAVLKELLQKRQQKAQNANIMQDSLTSKQPPNKIISGSLEHKANKRTRAVTSPRKPRTPRSTKPKEKTPKVLKIDSSNIQNSVQLDNSLSDDSPIFFSDPGFESCYSLEDSLSPEHNYTFDINTIGQTGFCSFYSGSQFVPADQNLPQKFLSDAAQDLFPGQAIEKHEFLSHDNQKCDDKHHVSDSTSWIRSSPELFEKSSIDGSENHCHHQWKNSFHSITTRSSSIMDSFCVQQAEDCLNEKSRLSRSSLSKEVFLSLSQPSSSDWIQGHTRKEMGQSLDSVNTSFTTVLSSPDGELVDAASEDLELYVSRNNMLSPTPDSSPRSASSPLQSKNGIFTPRAAHILKPLMSPPSRDEIVATLLDHDLSETIYQEPFCSNPSDVPEKPREIGGRLLMVETRLPNDLAEFEGDFSLEGLRLWKTAFSAMTQNPRPGSPIRNGQSFVHKGLTNNHKMVEDKKIVIMPCKCAPSRQLVQAWLQAKEEYERSKKLPKIEPTGILEAVEIFSPLANPDDKPIVPPQMNESPHILPTTAHTKEDVDNSHIALQAPTTRYSQTSSKSHLLLPVASASDPEKDEGDDNNCYVSYSSPESPVIPPWQQATSPDSKTLNRDDGPSSPIEKLCSLAVENFLKPVRDDIQKSPCSETGESLVISPVRGRTGKCESLCLHSTPIIQRKLMERLPEVTSVSPLSTEPKTQKLNNKKGSNTDTLRRVLLTTQTKNQFATVNTPKKETSQIDGPSLNNTYGFKVSIQNLQEAKALHEIQNLTLISVELHARTRRDLEPDPEFDPICALFYCISSDTPLPDTEKTELTGVIVIDKEKTISGQDIRYQTPLLIRSGVTGLEVTYAADEKALFQEITHIIKRYDPDILLGYEIQMHSWGYLLQRAAALSVDLCQMISRVPDDKIENRFAAERDDYGSDTMSEINIVGRITLNLWRIMRNEVALTNYTFENVSFHILHQRFPLFTFRVLSDWFDNKTDLYRWKMVDHYVSRVRGNLQMLEQLDLIGKTSEMARLFGIQFLHVLTRGSQYRVESMMLRIAKPMNYIPVTPSIQQRSQMRAPQCVPLIMEPESRFYSNSVLVLDFQSLYPSIVIAYNYCFSTCLGHVENLGKYEEFKFGCTSLRVPPDLLYQIRHDITVSPNGVAFVKPSIRKGVLPRMLEEILKTRLMVKQSMKAYKQDKALSRMLNARQLGLKLIANVTFGYTAANFSGRMPCIEVGDSIVHKARETLERAIKLVNDTKKWGARVVYGDTDSMFVLLKGATKEQSFKIGQEIAEAVTATNPKPVKLKFEKVYLPCVLQTKKRYVGYMYETLDQKDPVFDAKGIETVRRDSCPAVSKILERSLKLLFETRDISLIKQYVQRQCMKLLEGKASIQDFIFAKEYRGSSSYKPGACVPALELTRKMVTHDRRSEPRVGERVPYVIIYGTPGVPLIQLVRRPGELLQDPTLRLNAIYYITKQILPPLARIFSLIGIDVFSWYHELPRIQKAASSSRSDLEGRKGTISQYFTTLHCPVCDDLTQHGICSKCRSQPQHVTVILNQEIRELERKQEQLLKICKNCTGSFDRHIPCVSLNCPVLFKLSRVNRDLSKAPYLRQLLDQF